MRLPPALAAASALLACSRCTALDNGVGALPFMGWTTWDALGCRPSMNETTLRDTADAMVHLGLRDAGYTRLNIDDCWQQRGADGLIVGDPVRFPSGMAALAEYVHAQGLQLGVYSDVGTTTCAGHPGSWQHEREDAAAYAAWGVDFLKNDHCNLPKPLPPGMDEDDFYNYALALMRDALNATGRRIHYDLCAHTCYASLHDAGCWARWYANASALGNSHRSTTDATHSWASVLLNWYRNDAFGNGTLPLAPFAGPFSYNDPDALQVGKLPASVTLAQLQTHMAAWCIMAAPLVLGMTLGSGGPPPSADVLSVVLNADAITVDQDPLGVQGERVRVAGAPIYWVDEYGNGLVRYPQEAWAKPLAAGGARALLLVNHDDAAEAFVAADCADIAAKYPPALTGSVSVYDLWAHRVVAEVTNCSFGVVVPPGSSRFLRLSPAGGDYP